MRKAIAKLACIVGTGLFWSPCLLSAATITGTVINKTRQKPAAGDDVVLLSLSQGMQESARTKTDGNGRFNLQVPDEGVQHLIRVVHQGVNYHKPAPQGTTSADIEVYDAAEKVDKIFGEGRILRLQTSNGQLQVSEMYILRNESSPPRTQMSAHGFEVVLPEGAEIESGMAAGPGGMPVTSAPVPTGEKNHYGFVFPIRPGRTQLQLSYRLRYSGAFAFNFVPHISFAEIGVMLPKSMRFTATGDAFQQAADESGLSTWVAKSVSPGQPIAFSVSGEGSAPSQAQDGSGSVSGTPGGGLGTPVQGDNPIGGATTWYVLGGLAIALAGGAYFVSRRPPQQEEKKTSPLASAAAAGTTTSAAAAARHVSLAPSPSSRSRSESVLEALKEELFQIESERLQGKMTEQQYSQLKNGIDALMRRHLGKNS